MGKRRGNSSKYPQPERRTLGDDRIDFETLKEWWRKSVKRDPFIALHDRVKKFDFVGEAPNASDVLLALDFLALVTGDEIFLSALLAMRGYGFVKGGLKQQALCFRREGHSTAAWAAMSRMHCWMKAKNNRSARDAAARTAVQLGIPGTSFDAVVDSLEKAYKEWLPNVQSLEPAIGFPDGDTVGG